MMFFVLDTVLYAFLAWYAEQVRPCNGMNVLKAGPGTSATVTVVAHGGAGGAVGSKWQYRS